MQKSYKCPQCGKDVLYITNPCPFCKLKLDWRQQPPIPYIAPPETPQQPAYQQPISAPQQQVGQSPIEVPTQQATIAKEPNFSMKGVSADLPAVSRGWNWGAFFLTWIWGIGNSVWIAFLVFIPFVNLVMPFILGAKGNKWAWENKSWDSIEHFQKTQKTWARWGIGLFIVPIVIGVVFGLLGIGIQNLTKYAGTGANLAACTEKENIQTAVRAYQYDHNNQIPPDVEALDQYLLSKPKGKYVIDSNGVVVQESYGMDPPCNSSYDTTTSSPPSSSTPAPTPKTYSPPTPSWTQVASWSGDSIKNTETFSITADEWRINWSTRPGKSGDMNFAITVYSAGGSLKSIAANVIGAGSDVSYIRGAGRYYLGILAGQPYTISIEQNQ